MAEKAVNATELVGEIKSAC